MEDVAPSETRPRGRIVPRGVDIFIRDFGVYHPAQHTKFELQTGERNVIRRSERADG